MIVGQIGSTFIFAQGFRDATVSNSERLLRDLRGTLQGFELQLLRADRVAGREHIAFAARNAVDAFKGKARRAKHLSMEFLLYASGEHQIIEAIKLLGVTPSNTGIVVVGLSATKPNPEQLQDRLKRITKGTLDDSVLDIDPQKITGLKKAYRISDKELAASKMPGEEETSVLKKLIIERSALLALHS